MRRLSSLYVVVFVLLSACLAGASPFVGSITFIGLNGGDPVDDFYISEGISFTGFTAVAGDFYLCEGTEVTCSASVASGSVMNVAPGFANGLSFYFKFGGSGDVLLYDQPDGQGTLLADVALWPATSLWEPFGFTFGGLAHSAVFNGDMEVAVVTMGGAMVLPEPSSIVLLLSGLGSLAYFGRRRP
jgi:hypothetical protein